VSDWQAFHNRISKNWKHVSKWAKRQGLHCFRLYDKDIPAFPLILDWYQGHVHIQEYETHWRQTESEHEAWLSEAHQTIAQALTVPPEYLHGKRRHRQRGRTQYGKTGVRGQDFIVEEQGHRFWVNLDAYVDTGLFLDHRPTRRRVEMEAAGKRVLNLFCYTGAFTVYAGAGGAVASESVDLSNTYLDWAKRNLLLNQLDLARHKLVRADVLSYLQTTSYAKFDLIILDPPSFSNSAKMHGILDIQRDHSNLIQACLHRLSENGILYFSTNLRGFTLDTAWHTLAENISAQSVPDDFRNKKIHQCWRIVNSLC
jgi:23S rRNA (cytosine1962-C5)-methyltransferase